MILFFGLAIVFLLAIPGNHRIDFTSPDSPYSIRDRLQRALHSAGIFDQAPSIYIIGIIASSAALALTLVVFSGHIWAAIPAPFIVLAGVYLYLNNKQKRYLDRAHDELVPFLNRISTATAAKKPVQQAYMDAVEEADVLKEILSDSAAKIASGSPFIEALIETIPLLPIRMWAVFVRQLELYSETGGDIGETLDRTIRQVNSMISLQAEARADFAMQEKQQQLILLVPVALILIWIFFLPDGVKTMMLLVTTVSGWISLAIGLGLISFGVWFMKRQTKDIQERIQM